MIDNYTRLLESVAETGDEKLAEEAVWKLVAHLKSAGRAKMLGQILSELQKVNARRKALAPAVEVADKREERKALHAAAALGIKATKAEVNPSLISGWRARGAGLLVDRSGKGALVELYRHIAP